MSSQGDSSHAPATSSYHETKLRSHLESNPVTFHIKTGRSKWACTLLHKNTLERQRAARTNSQTSQSSTSSTSSVGSH